MQIVGLPALTEPYWGEGSFGELRSSQNYPSPQPSPLSTGEREQESVVVDKLRIAVVLVLYHVLVLYQLTTDPRKVILFDPQRPINSLSNEGPCPHECRGETFVDNSPGCQARCTSGTQEREGRQALLAGVPLSLSLSGDGADLGSLRGF